jgi:soluble lytic murein transglycosylase
MGKNRRLLPLKICIGLLAGAALVVATFIISREVQKLTYKLNYPDEITLFAQKYDLDPYLVAAVIHTESGNRPAVASNKGAVGLMQVLPSTGEWIAEKIDLSLGTDAEAALKRPPVNIELGCWYLNYLSERFDSPELVLCAYNAGPNRVAGWLEDPELTKSGELIEIPFPETEKYVERVLTARKKYQELYSQQLG